jgi:hypothetical protein
MLFQTLQPYWSKRNRIEVERTVMRFENVLSALGAITWKGSDILFCRIH